MIVRDIEIVASDFMTDGNQRKAFLIVDGDVLEDTKRLTGYSNGVVYLDASLPRL